MAMTDPSVTRKNTTSSALALEHPQALQVPVQSVNTGFQLLISLAKTAVWFSILPISQILLPLQVAALDPSHKFTNLAIATSVGVLAALLTNPIAGAFSDRTTSRLGRRRPWLIIGTILSAITLALMSQASSFVTLVLWWAIFHVAANAVLAALAAVVPDRVPVHQRATISALVSLSLPLGSVIGVLLVTRVVPS